MKRYKIIIGITILLLMFLFTGCDAILESFYPEYGDGDKGGGNEIMVWVEVDPSLDLWDVQIWAKVEKAYPDDKEDPFVDDQCTYLNWDENDNPYASFDFWGIPDGEYRVVVWIETQGNQWPDWEEIQAPATWKNFDVDNPKNEWYEDVFRFPNEHEWSSITGGAFLGAVKMNTLFNVEGEFVINSLDPGSKTYNIVPEDPDRRIRDLNWDLYDAAYGWQNSGWDNWPDGTPTANITVDYSLECDYWLEIGVTYMDDTYEMRRYFVRKINEAAAGTPYDLSLNIWGVTYDPLRLEEGFPYKVRVSIGSQSDEAEIFCTENNLIINHTDFPNALTGITYNPSFWGDANDVDYIEVIIDTNKNDNIGDPGDMKLVSAIGLSVDDLSPLWLCYDGWDFRPIHE